MQRMLTLLLLSVFVSVMLTGCNDGVAVVEGQDGLNVASFENGLGTASVIQVDTGKDGLTDGSLSATAGNNTPIATRAEHRPTNVVDTAQSHPWTRTRMEI